MPDPQTNSTPVAPANYVAPGERLLDAAGEAMQGTHLQKAYDAAKSWLGEHEDKLDEKYLAPFRAGLDNMAGDLEDAAEKGHTKSGIPLTGPTKALAEGAAAGLRMVPIGKTTKETMQAVIAPPELKEENLAKQLVEGEGLIYKGEVSPGTGVHQIEHPDHPGLTSTFRESKGLTPENVHTNMERKVKEFGKEYVPPNDNKVVYRARPVGQEGIKAAEHPLATDTKAKAQQYKQDLETMTGKPHEVVEIPLKGTSHTAHPHPTNEGETWYRFQKDVPEEKINAPKKEAAPETKGAASASDKSKSSSQSDKAKKAANEKGSNEL